MYILTFLKVFAVLHFLQPCASNFCYKNGRGCGPNTTAWPSLCHSGTRQSPIDIPIQYTPAGILNLNLNIYKGSHFNLRNNGHTIVVDFDNDGPHTLNLTFPDPLKVSKHAGQTQGQRQYRFAAGHFHWGPTEKVGSEHTLGGRASAMELHLVHYLAKYSNLRAALHSGDESALAVIGLLVDVSRNRKRSALASVAKNLSQVTTESESIIVEEYLDFSKLLREAGPFVYTYKGSLTTPGCQEQVNWYVFANPAKASKQEIQAFRSFTKDDKGLVLHENYRPVQKLNRRKVNYVRVTSSL